jgi:hypothetical protein
MPPTWRDQYDRMTRWRLRLSEPRRADESEADYEARFGDFVRTFFIESYHLVDWLANDPAVPLGRAGVERLANVDWLRRCKSICDGSKHLVSKKGCVTLVTRALELEQGGRLLLEDGPGVLLLEESFADVETQEGTWDAIQAADSCVSEWERILREVGLLHS